MKQKFLDTQFLLENELERLKRKLKVCYELRVFWVPKADSKLAGEVDGTAIFIYESEADDAVRTLRHELIDYAIGQAIEPYKEVANKLIAIVNEQAYERKEKLVGILAACLSDPE